MDRNDLIQGAKYIGLAAVVAASVHCCDSGFKHDCDIFGNKVGIYSIPKKCDEPKKKIGPAKTGKHKKTKKQILDGPKSTSKPITSPTTIIPEYKKAGEEDDGKWNIYAVDFRKSNIPSLTKHTNIDEKDLSKDVLAVFSELMGKNYKSGMTGKPPVNASYNIKGTLGLLNYEIGAKKNFNHIHSEWSNSWNGEVIDFNGKQNDRFTFQIRADKLEDVIRNLKDSVKKSGYKLKPNVTIVVDSKGQANALMGTDPKMCFDEEKNWIAPNSIIYRACPTTVNYTGGGVGGVVIINDGSYRSTVVGRQPMPQPRGNYTSRGGRAGNRP